MKGSRIVIATALTLALSGAALAQQKGRERDRSAAPTQQQRRPESDHTMRSQPASQWQQGSREQDRHDDRDRATAQWQQERRDGDRDRDGDDRYRSEPASGTYYPSRVPNGVYGAYRTQGLGEAQQRGYQDGVSDGSNDRATGHSYRPTEDSNYRHANRGWNSGRIDRDSYSSAYRQAYMQGYQRGYGSVGSGAYGRWPY